MGLEDQRTLCLNPKPQNPKLQKALSPNPKPYKPDLAVKLEGLSPKPHLAPKV